TMSTEFDLSFGTRSGFAEAVAAIAASSTPASAAAAAERARLFDPINGPAVIRDILKANHMLTTPVRDPPLTLPSFTILSSYFYENVTHFPRRRVHAVIPCPDTCCDRPCSAARACRGRPSGNSPRRC